MKNIAYKFILLTLLLAFILPASQARGAYSSASRSLHGFARSSDIFGVEEPPLENIPPMLTSSQKLRLQNAALHYVTTTDQQSVKLARDLKFVKNDGDPSNMCGPLAVAILKQAGLLGPAVSLHDFWLLNPRKAQSLLAATFPAEKFFHHRFYTPINEFDFTNFPLHAGDFVYLYAGRGGSFEHVLTVSRVDEFGRAFAVTNIRNDKGYLVQEIMLYDPQRPGAGQFYEWTDRRNSRVGRTGMGGFELWRYAAPVEDLLPTDQAFAQNIEHLLEAHGGKWYIVIKEVGGRVVYEHDPYQKIHIASTVKVPIAILFFQAMKKKPVDLWGFRDFLNRNGTNGRTYDQLLSAMLVNSEEVAGSIIQREIQNSRIDMHKLLSSWGASRTDILTRRSTAMDVATLLEGLYTAENVLPDERQYILNFMRAYTANDDTRLGVVRSLQPPTAEFYNKRGSIVDEFLLISDSALIGVPTPDGYKVYTVVAFGYGDTLHRANDRELAAAIEELGRAFWEYTTTGEPIPQQ